MTGFRECLIDDVSCTCSNFSCTDCDALCLPCVRPNCSDLYPSDQQYCEAYTPTTLPTTTAAAAFTTTPLSVTSSSITSVPPLLQSTTTTTRIAWNCTNHYICDYCQISSCSNCSQLCSDCNCQSQADIGTCIV